MRPRTRALWARQDAHPGDHARLFSAVAGAVEARTVLYPGSWVDVAASVVWPTVVYVDTDRAAARFFADAAGVRELLAGLGAPPDRQVRFLAADYRDPLPLPDGEADLLLSLHAGPVSAHCTRYLQPGGALLAHPGHGDVALAALDDRYALDAVVESHGGGYAVRRDDLADHLVPVRGPVTRDAVLRSGRGVAYTRAASAYLFRRVA